MGGWLTVRSTERVGSEFMVRLPAPLASAADLGADAAGAPRLLPADVVAAPPESPDDSAADRPEDALRVLVAEDNPVNQRIAQHLLRKRKLSVTLADDGRQAVDAFQAGRFDLVLMDVQMPEMDGFEAVAAIRALEHAQGRPHTPIVAVTAHAMVGDREKCLAGRHGRLPVQAAAPSAALRAGRRAARLLPEDRHHDHPLIAGPAQAVNVSRTRVPGDSASKSMAASICCDSDRIRRRPPRARQSACCRGAAAPASRLVEQPLLAGPHLTGTHLRGAATNVFSDRAWLELATVIGSVSGGYTATMTVAI